MYFSDMRQKWDGIRKTDSLKEQATAIVNAMKYPCKEWPKGIRGAGAMFAPANFSQNDREYLTTSNDNILVIVQIESRLGVENCERIAAVDGIGMLQFLLAIKPN
jgi:2-keto-3-deoxy-L-rhamnonate aldolase RhmA